MRSMVAFCLLGVSALTTSAKASQWYLVGEHYHTTTEIAYSRDPSHHKIEESYRSDGIVELRERAEKVGLDAMLVTEHNTVAPCFDALFTDRSSKVTLICGEEWTTHRGLHIGLLNPP